MSINADEFVKWAENLRKPKWISAADLHGVPGDTAAPIMTVDRILPLGALTLCSAKAKSGKTWFATALCHAVATGRPFLGAFEVRQAPVLYWLPDDPNLSRYRRIWQTFNEGGATVANFHL